MPLKMTIKMTNKEMIILREGIEKLSLEAKGAFIKKFPYLKMKLYNIEADTVMYNVPETDGSIFVEVSCVVTIDFDTLKRFISEDVARYNYKIERSYTSKEKIVVTINRFFYHTKGKYIFSM